MAQSAGAARAQRFAAGAGQVNPWLIALTVTLATFMEVLDSSIANVALPHIAGSLGAGQEESTWVLTSYLVANAIILPMSSWFALVLGRKRFYMTCVALFTLSSMMCGIAPSLPLLVLFRIIQGASGGGLGPSEQAILADTFPPAKRGMAFAVYGVAVVVAPVLGPVLGGFITDNYSWRWIFYINVPVGIISLFLTSRLVHDPPELKRERENRFRGGLSIDYIGMSLIALGLGTLQYVLDKGEREDWFSSNVILSCAIICVAALVGAVWWELRHKEPVVDLHLFRNRTFAISQVMMFVLGFVLYGSTTLLPLMVQTLFGYSATNSGLLLTPAAIVLMFMMPLSGVLVGRVQARWLVAVGMVGQGLALFHLSHFNLATDYRGFMLARVYQTMTLAFLFIPINIVSYVGVPKEKNNDVSGMINLVRNLGGSFGIAIAATVETRRLQYHHHRLAEHATWSNQPFMDMLNQLGDRGLRMIDGLIQRQSAMRALKRAYWFLGVLVFCTVPLIFIMRANDPRSGGEVQMH